MSVLPIVCPFAVMTVMPGNSCIGCVNCDTVVLIRGQMERVISVVSFEYRCMLVC